MANSLNGWPRIPSGTVKARTWKLPLITGRVRKRSVWVILYWLVREFDRLVEPVVTAQSWGWSYRKIAGSDKWSNHSSGTAVDLNAPRHPAGKRNTFSVDQMQTINRLLAKLDGVVRWGRLFDDEMHFEIGPDVSYEDVRRVATRLLQDVLVKLGYDLGKTGPNGDGVDGVRGSKTVAAVKSAQKKHQLTATGTDTPALWAALLDELRTTVK